MGERLGYHDRLKSVDISKTNENTVLASQQQANKRRLGQLFLRENQKEIYEI